MILYYLLAIFLIYVNAIVIVFNFLFGWIFRSNYMKLRELICTGILRLIIAILMLYFMISVVAIIIMVSPILILGLLFEWLHQPKLYYPVPPVGRD